MFQVQNGCSFSKSCSLKFIYRPYWRSEKPGICSIKETGWAENNRMNKPNQNWFMFSESKVSWNWKSEDFSEKIRFDYTEI